MNHSSPPLKRRALFVYLGLGTKRQQDRPDHDRPWNFHLLPIHIGMVIYYSESHFRFLIHIRYAEYSKISP